MTPRAFVKQELKLVQEMFNVQKSIGPMFIMIRNNQRDVILIDTANDSDKDIASLTLKEIVKMTKPDIVVYMSEAWALYLPKGTNFEDVTRPMFNPDRIEQLVVQIEFKTGEKFGCSANILRDKGEVKLSEFEIMDAKLSTGKFVDFFPPTYN